MQQIVEPDQVQLLHRFARDFETQLKIELEQKSKLFILLTGGTLGISVLEEIAQLDLPWERFEFCFGDERFVPLDAEDRNEYQALVAWPQLANLRLLRFPNSEDEISIARSKFDQEFVARFGDVHRTNPVFDLAIMGFGPDGHIASLFPGRVYPESWIVSEENSPKPPTKRLSLSYQALNRAKRVWFLAAGKAKSDVVACALRGDCRLPLAKIQAPEMRWYLDQELSDAL